MAVVSRRIKMKQRLEAKLQALTTLAGRDLSLDQLTRVAEALLLQEQELRSKQNTLSDAVNASLQQLMDELLRMRSSVDLIMRHCQPARPHAQPSGSSQSQPYRQPTTGR